MKRTIQFILLILPLLQGCGVTARLNERVPPPRRIAVLPMAGEAAAKDRALIRSMLGQSLLVRNVSVVENAYVDRVLSEEGWMTDPGRFDPFLIPPAEVCRALGVEGIIIGTGFETEDREYFLYFRRGLQGRLMWWSGEGRLYWEADHCATRSGGVLIGSDQIITTISEHVENGTSLAFVEVVEEYLDEVLATLPEFDPEGLPRPVPPAITGIEVERIEEAAGEEGKRIRVTAKATAGSLVTFDLIPGPKNIPTIEVDPGRYTGIYARLPGDGVQADSKVRVRARSPDGRETVQEAGRNR